MKADPAIAAGASIAADASIAVGGIEPESIVDGPGFRYVVFVQGCPLACPGCHNPQLRPFEGGRPASAAELMASIRANPLLDGLTLSGGEPFAQAGPCAVLAEQVRAAGLSVITYTGGRWEDLLARETARRLIEATDILVDGPFVQSLRNIDLRFRGSSNQRLIDVRQSLAAGRAVLLPEPEETSAALIPAVLRNSRFSFPLTQSPAESGSPEAAHSPPRVRR